MGGSWIYLCPGEFWPLCFMPSGSDIYKFSSQTGDLSGQCEKMG